MNGRIIVITQGIHRGLLGRWKSLFLFLGVGSTEGYFGMISLLSCPNVFCAFLYMYALSRSFEKLKGRKEGREGGRNRPDCPPFKPDLTSLYS